MDLGGVQLTSEKKAEVMAQVKQQIAIANLQETIQKMTEKCFNKCIGKPGTSLSSSEQKCVAMCMDRYIDSLNLVSRSYSNRIQQEAGRIQ